MPDKLAHHARVGHDRSVHQMLRNEGRLRRCRKRDIVLHRTPLAVAREKLDDGAHAVATVAVPLNHGRPELGSDSIADGAVLAYLIRLSAAGRCTWCSIAAAVARNAGGASAIHNCHVNE